jgi:alkylation response protein AidB-like acyl-CoA dehydrogenase
MIDQSSQWYKLQYPECFVSEEQRMLQKMWADFADKEIMPVRNKIDDDVTHKEIITPIMKKICVDLGFQKAVIPKEYGGLESLSIVTDILRNEQLARADYGISMATDCINWGLTPAYMAYLSPEPEAKAWADAIFTKFGPKFVGDELQIACFNMSEEQSATDIENILNKGQTIRVRAKQEGDEWVVNGSKMWGSNSGVADLNCVPCNLNPTSDINNFSLVYVPEPWQGVSHGKFEVKCGVQADRNTSTFFDDVRVPKEWGLSGPIAWRIFETNNIIAFVLDGGNGLGVLQGAFDTLLEYTGQRVVGGKIIRDHLSSAMIIGEMAAVLNVCRSALLELGHQCDHPEIYGDWDTKYMKSKACSIHTFIWKTATELIAKGMELMGCYGYVRENHYEKYYRDVAVGKLIMGGVQQGYFGACLAHYDLDYSSFGPGKLEIPK